MTLEVHCTPPFMKNIFNNFKIGDKVKFVPMLSETEEDRSHNEIYTITGIDESDEWEGYIVKTDRNPEWIPYHFYEKYK